VSRLLTLILSLAALLALGAILAAWITFVLLRVIVGVVLLGLRALAAVAVLIVRRA
jgi:hypothetical protein